jgi:hypothetical protein
MNNNNIFVVENGINTSYIDSLLIALFYKQSYMQEILFQQTENDFFIYLQDLIYNNFVCQFRNGFSIGSGAINEIRNYSYLCGWKNGFNILDLYNVVDYFSFLMSGLIKNLINIEIMIVHPIKNTQTINNMNMNYIELKITENSDVKTLLKDWENIFFIEKKNTYYNFKEIPIIIPIYLNRYTTSDINFSKIDIKNKIKFYKNNDNKQINFHWNIHSIICFSNSGAGSYYSLFNIDNNIWYLFNNMNIPALSKIDISENDISTKIMQECVLLFYKLND